MTKLPSRGKDDAARHPYGPRALGAVLPGVMKPSFRKGGAALATLMTDWPGVVGHALARDAHPRRFSAGTLTIGCTGPVALELQHLAGQIIERINGHLGRGLVARLRFVQEAGEAPGAPITAPPPQLRLAPVQIDGLPDGELRDALAALGAAVKADRA